MAFIATASMGPAPRLTNLRRGSLERLQELRQGQGQEQGSKIKRIFNFLKGCIARQESDRAMPAEVAVVRETSVADAPVPVQRTTLDMESSVSSSSTFLSSSESAASLSSAESAASLSSSGSISYSDTDLTSESGRFEGSSPTVTPVTSRSSSSQYLYPVNPLTQDKIMRRIESPDRYLNDASKQIGRQVISLFSESEGITYEGDIGSGVTSQVMKVQTGRFGTVALKLFEHTDEVEKYSMLTTERVGGEGLGLPLNHPNIMKTKAVIVCDTNDPNKKCYLFEDISQINRLEGHKIVGVINEYIPDSIELFDYISSRRQSFTSGQLKHMARQILEAMKYLHKEGQMHRDLKLSNILINPVDGHITIIDNGMMRTKSSAQDYDTKCGTPNFVAPEVMLQDKYDEKADIFSIGSTLFTMAFGSLLFDKRSKGDAMAMSRELVDYGRFGLRVQDIMTSRHKRMRNYANPRLMDLLEGLLQADPSRRLSAEDALKHPFFS